MKQKFIALCAVLCYWQLHAQPLRVEITQENIRLSEWLALNPSTEQSYQLGLMWLTPEEKLRQENERRVLIQQPGVSSNILKLFEKMPATGRVNSAVANTKWLEAQPKRDALLQKGDVLLLPQRPNNLRVINDVGHVCEVPHKSSALAQDYISACNSAHSGSWAWVVQPDGRVQRVGVSLWNRAVQNEPAPGAWIWAPSDGGTLPRTWHNQFAKWLSYQGATSNTSLTEFADFSRQVMPVVPTAGMFDLEGRYQQPQVSANNWGVVGLVQTPSARMREAGSFGLSFHKTWPYHWVNLMFQPLDWMEAGFRYTSINNRLYSPYESWSGNQSYLDKSIDVKARLWRESAWLPEVAVGMRDVGGTGLFSSEFLVVSKRTGRLDWSAGLGWGNLGGRGNVTNPLSRVLGQQYDVRQNDFGLGGKFSTSSWFKGKTAFFGGVEYQTPWNLVLKAEYDGNNYKNEPLGNVLPQTSPINWAVVYRPMKGVDISAGVERGNTWSFGMTFYTDMASLHMPKVTAPAVPRVTNARPSGAPDWQQTAQDIEKTTLWDVRQIYTNKDSVVIDARNSVSPYPEERLQKGLAVLHRDLPAEIENITIHHRAAGDVLTVESVNRQEWVQTQTLPARTQAPAQNVPLAYNANELAALTTQLPQKQVDYRLEPGLDLVQTIGGPDGYLYQFRGNMSLGLEMPWNTKLSGVLSARLFDNYDNFKDEGWSNMPRVRTYTKQFLTTSRVTLTSLSLSKTDRLAQNWYWTGYTGYFESMYGGVGTEVLYRRPASRWAVGVDYNKVRMRDFHQNFQFQELKADTGHITGYWETPIEGISTSLSYGQYLAGDRGMTLTLSKVFNNGTTISAYITKTNVPAEVFGEGSFDKGVAWVIPFDAFLTSHSRYSAGWAWKPLVRDGGARLIRPVNLFAETSWLSPKVKSRKAAPPPNDRVAPDDRVEDYLRLR